MAIELRFGKPSIDCQKLILRAAAAIAARWSAFIGGGALARQLLPAERRLNGSA